MRQKHFILIALYFKNWLTEGGRPFVFAPDFRKMINAVFFDCNRKFNSTKFWEIVDGICDVFD